MFCQQELSKTRQNIAIQNLLSQNSQYHSSWQSNNQAFNNNIKKLFINSKRSNSLLLNNSNIYKNYLTSSSLMNRKALKELPKLIKSTSLLKSNKKNSQKLLQNSKQQFKPSYLEKSKRAQDFKIAAYNTQYKWSALQRKYKLNQITVNQIKMNDLQIFQGNNKIINFNNYIDSNKLKSIKIKQMVSKINKNRFSDDLKQEFNNDSDQLSFTKASNIKFKQIKSPFRNIFQHSPKKARQSIRISKTSKIEPQNTGIVGIKYFK